MQALQIPDYAGAISLYDTYAPPKEILSSEDEMKLVELLLDSLKRVLSQLGINDHSAYNTEAKRNLLEAAITVLPPDTLSSENSVLLNRLLYSEQTRREITKSEILAKTPFFSVGHTKVILWQGDITCLKADAIVNAANNAMLGCFQPMHKCIDNAIHSRAGVQLRSDCQKIMTLQNNSEPTGTAKITRAYNLPSKYVIHTVGPIVRGMVNAKDKGRLASSYTSILDITNEIHNINNIAFCSISTGVFGFPIEQAAPIAVRAVCGWLKAHPNRLDSIVFNVFSNKDHYVYQSVLEELVEEMVE